MGLKRKAQVVIYSLDLKKVLLVKTNTKRGSFWQNITGGVDDGEEYLLGALRELKEETHYIPYKIIPLEVNFQFTDQYKNSVNEESFLAVLKNHHPEPQLDSHEHDTFQWLSSEEITVDHYGFESNFEAFEKAKKCFGQF